MRIVDRYWRHGTHKSTAVGVIAVVVCGNASTNVFAIRIDIFSDITSAFIDDKVVCSSIDSTRSRGLWSSLAVRYVGLVVTK